MSANHLIEAYNRNPRYFYKEEMAPSLGEVFNITVPVLWSPL
jgi:hypothetical protein